MRVGGPQRRLARDERRQGADYWIVTIMLTVASIGIFVALARIAGII